MNKNAKLPNTPLAATDSPNGIRRSADESLTRLEAILGGINDGVIVADVQGNVTSMNPAALAIHGYKSVEEARMHLVSFADNFELFDAKSQVLPAHRWPLARALAGERFSAMEVRIRRKDTGRVWYGSYSGTPVRDKSGDVILVVLTLREITGQKLAEESLRKAYDEMEERVQQRTAALSKANAKLGAEVAERRKVENALREREAELNEAQRVAGLGSWTWIMATDTTAWSPEVYHIFGRDPNLPLPPVSERLTAYSAESRTRFNDALENTLQTGSDYELDLEFVRPDGIRKWVRACGAAELGPDGKVAKLHGTVLDITARKLAEEELRKAHDELEKRVAERTAELSKSHARIAAILESIADGFVTLDREWRYTRVNSAALKFLRKQSEDLLGKIIWDVFPAIDSTRFGAALRLAMDENVPTQVEEFYPEPLNRWYECRCYPSPDGLTLFFTDITERRRSENDARDSNQRMRLATEATAVGIWEWNVVTNRIRWDAQMFRIYGIAPRQDGFVDYDTWKKSVLPEDLPEQEEVAGHDSQAGSQLPRIPHPAF